MIHQRCLNWLARPDTSARVKFQSSLLPELTANRASKKPKTPVKEPQKVERFVSAIIFTRVPIYSELAAKPLPFRTRQKALLKSPEFSLTILDDLVAKTGFSPI